MKKKILGYYDYTVVLTYCGMMFAFYGILQVIGQKYREAVFCLMLAGLCDMFDGAVAATKVRTENEKIFGIQIDSFCDLISFGVLPGIFIYMISGKKEWVGVLSSIYVLCSLIRLSYFNVMEEERQSQTTERRKVFQGVPVTTVALLLPLVYILYDYQILKNVIWFPMLLIILGVGFLSAIEIKKPGKMGKVCITLLGLAEALLMVNLAR